MTKLDPFVALGRVDQVFRRYPKFKAWCEFNRFSQHHLAALEIELELRRDAEERVRRLDRRMGRTVGDEIRALLAQEFADAQEQPAIEEAQTGDGREGNCIEASQEDGREDAKTDEGPISGGARETTKGAE